MKDFSVGKPVKLKLRKTKEPWKGRVIGVRWLFHDEESEEGIYKKGVQLLEMEGEEEGDWEKWLRFTYYAKDSPDEEWGFKSQTTLMIPIEEGEEITKLIKELLEEAKEI